MSDVLLLVATMNHRTRAQELQRLNEQLREKASLLDKAQDAILVRDPDGGLQRVSAPLAAAYSQRWVIT